MLIASEHTRWHLFSARRGFCKCVGRLVEASWDVVELETVKLVFQLSDLSVVRSHPGIVVG